MKCPRCGQQSKDEEPRARRDNMLVGLAIGVAVGGTLGSTYGTIWGFVGAVIMGAFGGFCGHEATVHP